MNKTLKWMMGLVTEEPKGERCAWKYKVQELIDNDCQVPKKYRDCQSCNGFPVEEGCTSYTTLSHLEHFYEMFQGQRDRKG